MSEQIGTDVDFYTFAIDNDGDEFKFTLLAELRLNLSPQVTIFDMRVSLDKRLWILCSNNTLLQYIHADPTDDTVLKYLLKRINIINLKEELKNLESDAIQFDFLQDYLVVFTARNLIAVLTLRDGINKIDSQYTLMLSYENPQEARDNYEFIRCKKGRVQYDVHKQFLLILYRNISDDSVVFNFYNLQTYRHNTLYLRETIIRKFDFENDFIQIQHIDLSLSLLRLIILTSNYSFQANLEIIYSFKISSTNAIVLDERCKNHPDGGFELNYTLYPSTNKNQNLSTTVFIKNNGLLITSQNGKVLNYTIYMLESPIVYEKYKLDGQLNINEIFQGFNMWYYVSYIKDDMDQIDHSKNVSNQLIVENLITVDDSSPMDFLSNSNQALELFNIGEFIVLIDSIGFIFVTKQIQADIYERQVSKDILGCTPMGFIYYENNILIYQCQPDPYDHESLKYGASLIYTDLPDDQDKGAYYSFFDGTLYVKYSFNQCQIYIDIKAVAIFKISEYSFYIALVFDIPNQILESNIQFNNVTFNNTNFTTYAYNFNDALYSQKFGLDQMKITCVQTIQGNDIMLIGVKNYGILIYDIFRKVLLKSINLRPLIGILDYQVLAIIQENVDNYYFVMDVFGVMSLKIYDYEQFKNESATNLGFNLVGYYNYVEGEIFTGNLIAQDNRGFAFVTQIISNLNSIYKTQIIQIMRYFSFDNADKSKFLGTRVVKDGLQCNKLRNFPIKYSQTHFTYQLPHDNYVFYGLLCQTDLYFYLFSWTYSMFYVHNEDLFDGIESTHKFRLTAYNDYDKEYAVLSLRVIKNYLNIPSVFYYLFAILILIVLFGLIQILLQNKGLLAVDRKTLRMVKFSESQDEYTRFGDSVSKRSWFFPSSYFKNKKGNKVINRKASTL
ncbi:UNKNOWN [Stylonychia lemnae]|uniref:Transmembrane protein n=1 Tax=Stylonychia lemnae TaxID=5949 RepID=A0A078AWU7_STYLE|nr:UNKNOWN [Stylonychia lemnae]|eukprot:CDW85283.1 UNKNOWN [Stylonychia lemnae]